MAEEQGQSHSQTESPGQDPPQPKKGSRVALIVVILIAALVALIAAWLLWSSGDDAELPVAEPVIVAPEDTPDEYESLEVGVGEPANADPFVITVTGAGREAIAVAETPPEGSSYYVVGVTFENNGPTVPVNGQPYSVDGTILKSKSGTYEGIMQVSFGNPLSEGTIPSGTTFVLNFIFTVPDDSGDFVFEWTPRSPEYPRIRVPIDG